MAFAPARKSKSKLRLALAGPPGSGKTAGALYIAKGLGGKIALLDTECGSASLYAIDPDDPNKNPDGIVEFDVEEVSAPYTPEKFVALIKNAETAGYNVLIIDSATHEWNGSGGCLEINETTARAKYRGNTWSAWHDTDPRHRSFINAMLHSKMHIICTGRSKTETVQQENDGRKSVVKLGMKTEQRNGFDFEFTFVFDIVHDGHYAVASKERTLRPLFGGEPHIITEETGKKILNWLENGVDVNPIEELLKSINASSTLEELKDSFTKAVKFHSATTEDISNFTEAKDIRKKQLEPTKTATQIIAEAANKGEL